MAMRKKAAVTAKVRTAWRCPGCGHKIQTAECYACLLESEREKKSNTETAQPKVANNIGENSGSLDGVRSR